MGRNTWRVEWVYKARHPIFQNYLSSLMFASIKTEMSPFFFTGRILRNLRNLKRRYWNESLVPRVSLLPVPSCSGLLLLAPFAHFDWAFYVFKIFSLYLMIGDYCRNEKEGHLRVFMSLFSLRKIYKSEKWAYLDRSWCYIFVSLWLALNIAFLHVLDLVYCRSDCGTVYRCHTF